MENMRPSKLLALLSFACLVSAAVGAVTGISVFHFMQAKPLKVVTTQRLEVVDSSGRTRALLSTNDRDEVSMNFTAVSGEPSFSVGVLHRTDKEMKYHPANGQNQQEWVPYLRMLEASGRPSAELITVGHGNAVLNFNGDEGGIALGYVGDGRDDGTFGAAWGLSASYKTFTNSIGVYAQDTDHPYSMVPFPPTRLR